MHLEQKKFPTDSCGGKFFLSKLITEIFFWNQVFWGTLENFYLQDIYLSKNNLQTKIHIFSTYFIKIYIQSTKIYKHKNILFGETIKLKFSVGAYFHLQDQFSRNFKSFQAIFCLQDQLKVLLEQVLV